MGNTVTEMKVPLMGLLVAWMCLWKEALLESLSTDTFKTKKQGE